MLKVALIPTSQFGHGACDSFKKVFRPTILFQIGPLRHWSYMSDHDNVCVGQSHIEMKIELAFAAGVSMSLDRSVQHDFILTEAALDSQPQICQDRVGVRPAILRFQRHCLSNACFVLCLYYPASRWQILQFRREAEGRG